MKLVRLFATTLLMAQSCLATYNAPAATTVDPTLDSVVSKTTTTEAPDFTLASWNYGPDVHTPTTTETPDFTPTTWNYDAPVHTGHSFTSPLAGATQDCQISTSVSHHHIGPIKPTHHFVQIKGRGWRDQEKQVGILKQYLDHDCLLRRFSFKNYTAADKGEVGHTGGGEGKWEWSLSADDSGRNRRWGTKAGGDGGECVGKSILYAGGRNGKPEPSHPFELWRGLCRMVKHFD